MDKTTTASYPSGRMRLKVRPGGAMTDERLEREIGAALDETGSRMVLNELVRRLCRLTGPYQYRISEARILRVLAVMAKRQKIYYVVIKAPDTE